MCLGRVMTTAAMPSNVVCTDENKGFNFVSFSFALVTVELRTPWTPLVGVLRLAHQVLPSNWAFSVFHANVSGDYQGRRWYTTGAMGLAVDEFRDSGRVTRLHTFRDEWLDFIRLKKTRTGVIYPRIRSFWTDYFYEDKILFLHSDSGFCTKSPYPVEMFTRVDWIGALHGSSTFGVGRVGNGGFSLRNRHAMYSCIDFLDKRSSLWDWRYARNEDVMFPRCYHDMDKQFNNATGGHFIVASKCLANKFSQEHAAWDALRKDVKPPFGFHDVYRSLLTFGKCRRAELNGTVGALPRSDSRQLLIKVRCARPGFSIDRAFNTWAKYCGNHLEYYRQYTDMHES